MRSFSSEHVFVGGTFTPAFGNADTNGYAGRFFFATGKKWQYGEAEDPEERVAWREQHGDASRPHGRAVVNGDDRRQDRRFLWVS